MTAIDRSTGTVVEQRWFPHHIEISTDDEGMRSMTLVIRGIDPKWIYDSVIGSEDGELSVLFFHEDD